MLKAKNTINIKLQTSHLDADTIKSIKLIIKRVGKSREAAIYDNLKELKAKTTLKVKKILQNTSRLTILTRSIKMNN